MWPRLVLILPLALLAAPRVQAAALAAGVEGLILSCPVCHGDETPPGSMPGYRGLGAAQIEQRLRDYRDGVVAGSAMPRLMLPLSDEQIRAIAQHYGVVAP